MLMERDIKNTFVPTPWPIVTNPWQQHLERACQSIYEPIINLSIYVFSYAEDGTWFFYTLGKYSVTEPHS